MKAFHFRLEPALRWRSTQLRLEQEALSRASAHVEAIRTELMAIYTELRAGAARLPSAGSAAFESWSAYAERCRRRILTLEEQSKQARKDLALQTKKMVEAHQQLRVLENLRDTSRADWERDLNRETEAFAGEAFLARLSQNSRTGSARR